MARTWEKQAEETEEWYARFAVFLSLGYSRSLLKAYRLVYPRSEATEVSSAWREEYRARKWRSRATDHDLSLFQGQARETAVMMGRGMRAFARKALRALLSKSPAMQPSTWEETQKAFDTLWRLLPADTLMAMIAFGNDEDDKVKGPGGVHHGPEDFDADGYLIEIPEDGFPVHGVPPQEEDPVRRRMEGVPEGLSPEEYFRRTGVFPREKHDPPTGQAPASPPTK